eukprot:59804-Pleurochrysis_carterae.AAC.1
MLKSDGESAGGGNARRALGLSKVASNAAACRVMSGSVCWSHTRLAACMVTRSFCHDSRSGGGDMAGDCVLCGAPSSACGEACGEACGDRGAALLSRLLSNVSIAKQTR